MENSFQTSFIPKKPIVFASANNGREKQPINIFSIITIFLLVVSVLASVGLFVYRIYLEKQKETLSSSLLVNSGTFEKNTIMELELFNKRTDSAKQVFDNHIVLSPLFTLLGDITIPQIQYLNFDEKVDEKGIVSVTIKGLANDYKAIALQSDSFNSEKGRSLKNVLFSNLSRDKKNNVGFDLSFDIDPNLISYEKDSLLKDASSLSDNLENTTQ